MISISKTIERLVSRAKEAVSTTFVLPGLAVVFVAVFFAVSSAMTPTSATTLLNIGLARAPTSFEPDQHMLLPDTTLSRHVFEPLVRLSTRNLPEPALATAWTQVDPTTWEFTLRPHVIFHDGTPFDSEAVAATFRRLVSRPGPGRPSFVCLGLVQITGVEALGKERVRITTRTAFRDLPRALSDILILPSSLEKADDAAFLRPEKIIGTGPFRVERIQLPLSVGLIAFPEYWGARPVWDRVHFKFIPDGARRVAALLSGDVDVIDETPPADAGRLSRNLKFHLISSSSWRIAYLGLDLGREVSPFLRDTKGNRLLTNPLRDRRVRQAMSLVLDRTDMAVGLLQGWGVPATQIVNEHLPGAIIDAPQIVPDLTRARRLMKDAGWENGFTLTLHCEQETLTAGPQTATAIALAFGRIGITVRTECQPQSTFLHRLERRDFSVYLATIGSTSGLVEAVFASLLLPVNDAGYGVLNLGRWNDFAFSDILCAANSIADQTGRNALLEKAGQILLSELPVIPIFSQDSIWVFRSGLTFDPPIEGTTLAYHINTDLKGVAKSGGETGFRSD